MPSIQTGLEVLSIVSNIVTVGLFIKGIRRPILKNISNNPFFKVLMISLLITALIFTAPAIWRIFKSDADQAVPLPAIIHDTITRRDTVTVIKTDPAPPARRTPTILQSNKTGYNNSIGRDNKGIQGKNNQHNHIVSGDHDTVGVNGDVYNYNGIKQRHPSKENIQTILDSVRKNLSRITVICIGTPAGDKEALIFGKEIEKELIKVIKGDICHFTLYSNGQSPFDIRIDDQARTLIIGIAPADNAP